MSLFMLSGYGALAALLCRACPGKFRWIVLLAASLGFYASRSLSGLPFILTTAMTTWLCAMQIGRIAAKLKAQLREGKETLSAQEKKNLKAQAKGRQRVWFYAALVLNFAILAVLKYTDDLLSLAGRPALGLLLPLGVSFYTFQSMGYLIDVYNGKYGPERNPARFLLYVSFFPQLIQGPIGRYDQLAPQLERPHSVSFKEMERGGMLVIWGLFKKMVIADRAYPLVESVFSAPAGEYGGAVIALGVLAYSLQQYCDFSGGIDLVTGLAQMMGVNLAPNFKRPYFAVSLGDFWRRWHISLGAWMRDHVFYPFALTRPVNRLSKAAKKRFGVDFARALPAALGNILVFLLVGVWHGATANYVLWGLYNGVVLAVSAMLEPAYKRWNAAHSRLAASKGFYVFRVLRTFVIVNIGWYFDRCAHAADAVRMLCTTVCRPQIWQLTGETIQALGVAQTDFRLLIACTCLLFGVSLAQERGAQVRKWVQARKLPLRWLILLAGVMSVLLFGVYGSGFNEASFIYYQF